MDSNSYPKPVSGTAGSFNELAFVFDATVVNDAIKIPEKRGKGIIKKIDAADGLQVTYWNIQLEHSQRFERASAPGSDKKTFSLFYIFTQDSFFIRNKADVTSLNTNDQVPKSIVFASSEIDLDFTIGALHPARAIQIDVTEEWLANEHTNSNFVSYPFFNDLINKKEPLFFTRPASFPVYHSFFNIYNHLAGDYPDPFYVRAKTLSLLSDIFINTGKQTGTINENNLLIHEKMIAVEKILDEHLDKNLPSIGSIARQMALSESTLKRNFKLLYGTSIYEYYLRKKMQKARQLFTERSIPVKEVAYMLGYEKVSNFIQMFKKHHNLSPGRLKKNNSLMKEKAF
jgi:AraC-like DNA-binding protein